MEHKIWICTLILGVASAVTYLHKNSKTKKSEQYKNAADVLHVVLAILIGGAVSIFTSGV